MTRTISEGAGRRLLVYQGPLRAIVDALHARGVTKLKDVAALIGEPPQVMSRYLGGVSPRAGKLQDWLDAAAAGGHPLVVTFKADTGCVATSLVEDTSPDA